jgi:hypothetical protein
LTERGSFTGHSLRRTSATLLADSGANILTLKRHGSWKSNSVAESYVSASKTSKLEIAKKFQQIHQVVLRPTVLRQVMSLHPKRANWR